MTYSPRERTIYYPDYAIKGLISGTTFVTGNDDNFALYTAASDSRYVSVKKARDSFTLQQGFDRLITLKQVHGDTIHPINKENLTRYIENPLIDGDGLITDCQGVLIGILTADCVPVFFVSPDGVIGIAHAGWKGLFAGIHNRMLEMFRSGYHIEPGDLRVWFGPNIRACCYEVGEELVDKFIDSGKNPVYYRKNGKIFFNLEETISAELISNGVNPDKVYSPAICTYENTKPRFFSFRRGDIISRTLSFIGIR